jgi:hypothetical protein
VSLCTIVGLKIESWGPSVCSACLRKGRAMYEGSSWAGRGCVGRRCWGSFIIFYRCVRTGEGTSSFSWVPPHTLGRDEAFLGSQRWLEVTSGWGMVALPGHSMSSAPEQSTGKAELWSLSHRGGFGESKASLPAIHLDSREGGRWTCLSS